MPKRIVDGEGVWRSGKLARVEPVRARAEYANLIPLALANGSFECSTRLVWSQVYSFNRPDVSHEDVEIFLKAFEEARLLFRWTDADGKQWGYFVGIDKPGRLPGKSRKGKNEKIGAEPPQEQLRKFLEVFGIQKFPGSGFGFGPGSGSGTGPRASHAPHNPAPSALGVCEQIVALWNSERGSFPEVLKLTQGRRRQILARLRSDPEFPKKLSDAVQKAKQTPFLCGAGDRGWKADFDWFVNNDTHCVAVLEGKYDGGKGALTNADQRTRNNLKAAGFVQ